MRRKMCLMLTIALSAFVFSAAVVFGQQRFSASLNAEQEVPVRSSSGSGTCMASLNLSQTLFTVLCNYSGLTSPVVGAHIHDAGPVGVNGPILLNFNYTGPGQGGTIGPLIFNVTPAQVADLRAKRWYVNIHTSNFTGGEIRGQMKITTTPFDLDGDGRTDIAVFRQSANTFYVLSSLTNNLIANHFGSGANDYWLNHTGDFDGDGRGDPMLLNTTNPGLFWSILQTGTNNIRTVQWGNPIGPALDKFAPSDYDGDGRTDIAVFRNGTGVWYIIESSTNTARIVQNFGAPGDFTAVGDYDKDGKSDLTVVRAEGDQIAWYTLFSSTGQSIRVPWGGAMTDIVYPFAQIDIDGDGAQDRMTARIINGTTQFNILRSSDNGQVYISWGLPTDNKLFGDYDGDGKTDIGARHVVNGQMIWYIYQSSNGQGRAVPFGATGDQ